MSLGPGHFPQFFNIYSWPPFIAMILSGALAAFVLARHASSKVHRAFAAWNASVAVWNLEIFLMCSLSDARAAALWGQALRNGLVFLYTLFFHFILLFIDDRSARNRFLLRLSYASSVFFLFANNFHHWMVSGLRRNYWGFYPVAGHVDPYFFLVWNLTVVYSLIMLYRAGRHQTGFRRNQYHFLLLGTSIFFASLLSNFLVVNGLLVYPIGNLMTIVYSLILAYAILTFGLLDIELAVEKGMYYLTLGGAVTGAYVLVVAVLEHMFEQHNVNTVKLFHLVAVPLTVAVTPRIKSALEPFAEQVIWRTRYKISDILHEFHESILTTLDLEKLSHALLRHLNVLLDVEESALYVKSLHNARFERTGGAGGEALKNWPLDHPMVRYAADLGDVVLKEPILWEAEHREARGAASPLTQSLRATPYSVIQPFFFRDELIGLLGLGPKRSGDNYNADDVRLLRVLNGPVAVALNNARSMEKIAEQQRQLEYQKEMDAIGIMATEMAHELAKPLTHIMNAGTRLDAAVKGPSRESLRRIEKEAQRASEILDGFAMLSPQRPLHRILMSLAELLEESVASLGLASDKRVRLVRQYDFRDPFPVNPGQLVQVFTNVIQNAWHAMPEGGVLTLALAGPRDAAGTLSAEIKITDTGAGISPDLQEKIFEPFFTTKQAQGGRGMGLTISRAMVERHGGTITIASPVSGGRGTEVRIHLPMPSLMEKSHEN